MNCAYARLAVIIGVNQIADIAEQMGITTHLDRVPAMTLGASQSGVSPLQMASAYATLADDGVHHKPYFIESVVGPDHKTIVRARPEGDRVIPSQIARMATSVLQQVVQRGTGTKARQRDREVAGKTGTAENYQDAWFVGYTPDLVVGVWVGNADNTPMRGTTGLTGAAPIWHDFMEYALAPLRRGIVSAMTREGAPTISAYQDRILHDANSMQRLLGTIGVIRIVLWQMLFKRAPDPHHTPGPGDDGSYYGIHYQLVAVTGTGLVPFDPFNAVPVENVNYRKDPAFGGAVDKFSYTSPRTFRFSVGVRF